MTIKKDSLDTFIILILMFSPIAPVSVAKLLVIFSLMLFIIRIILLSKISITQNKILIIILLLPGIAITAINSPADLIRFIIFFILIMGFPFSDFSINQKYVLRFSFFILLYLIVTQIFIAINNPIFFSFRENWYPNEFDYVWQNINMYGVTTAGNILTSIGKVRAGGLFYNPNVLASVITLYFFIFLISLDNFRWEKTTFYIKLLYFLFLSLIFLSLAFTFSKTYMVSFVLFFLLKEVTKINFVKLSIKFWHLFTIPAILLILFFLYDEIISSFYKVDGSMNIKLSTIYIYIMNEDVFSLIFGGRHDVFFDMEYGYWIGASGIIGFIGLFIFFRILYLRVKIVRLYLLIFLLMSIGNSLFYGLLTGVIALNVIIISSSIYFKNYER